MSRSKHFGNWFCREALVDRVAQKESPKGDAILDDFGIAFQETGSHCYGSSEIRFALYKTEWMENPYSESGISSQSFEI